MVMMRQRINKDHTSYHPNSLGGGCPFQAKAAEGGFTSYNERIDAKKIRARSASFFDHFSQATLFFNSQSEAEKNHLTHALQFELGKVQVPEIRERMVGLLSQVDKTLAGDVANALGLTVPVKKQQQPVNHSIPADGVVARFQPKAVNQGIEVSAPLSMADSVKNTIKTRKIAFLTADGVNREQIDQVRKRLLNEGASVDLIALKLGKLITAKGDPLTANKSLMTVSSVLYDAVYIPGGLKSVQALMEKQDAADFISLAYKHCKAIAYEADVFTTDRENYYW